MPKSNEYTPMYDDLPEHKKTRAFRGLMGWHLWQTMGFFFMFWRQVGKDSPSGELSGLASPERVLDAIGCNKDKIPEIIDALLESEFIEGDSTEGYRVHDWEDGAGKFTIKKEKDRIRKREDREKAKAIEFVHGQSTDSPRTDDGQSTDESRTVRAQEKNPNNPVTQSKRKEKTQGGCRGNAASSALEAKPPGFSSSSDLGSRVTGLSPPGEIPWDQLQAVHVFPVFRDLFLDTGISGATELSLKARKCRVTAARWTMLFLDKVHYAYDVVDGSRRNEQSNVDPVAMTVSGFMQKHSPTDSACQLFREVFVDIAGDNERRKRWDLLDGELVAEELTRRKGKR